MRLSRFDDFCIGQGTEVSKTENLTILHIVLSCDDHTTWDIS